MSELQYRDDVRAALDDLLLDVPGVKCGKAFSYPAYKVNGKVFAFVGGAGIALKLPIERVRALVGAEAVYRPFEVADGIIWKSWLSIDRADADEYRADLPQIEEAIAFVAGG
jgi:hypothetical protein